MHSTYITSALKPEHLPAEKYPEIALLGRSNSGKSSFINALLNRTSLAKTSKTPGRTQTVNFFLVNDSLMVVDIPGYGFSKTEHGTRKHWQDLISAYLKRSNIRTLILINDIRRDINEEDKLILSGTNQNLPLVVILTKADKLSKSQEMRRVSEIKKQLNTNSINFQDVIAVSNIKRGEFEPLRTLLLSNDS